MIPSVKKLIAPIVPHPDDISGGEMLKILEQRGLIDYRAAESVFARAEVERLVAKGRGRCRAMDEVADKLCCSTSKVRKILYSN